MVCTVLRWQAGVEDARPLIYLDIRKKRDRDKDDMVCTAVLSKT